MYETEVLHPREIRVQRPDKRAELVRHASDQEVSHGEATARIGRGFEPAFDQVPRVVGWPQHRQGRQTSYQRLAVLAGDPAEELDPYWQR